MTARKKQKNTGINFKIKKNLSQQIFDKRKKTEKNIYDIHDTDLMVFFEMMINFDSNIKNISRTLQYN